MTAKSFDIIVVTDPRFQGGTSSAVAAEIEAASQAGYQIGFLAYEAGNLRQPLPFNGRLARLIAQGKVEHITPGTQTDCTLAILHNPFVAELLPLEALGIRAEQRLAVLHHPPLDAFGRPYFDFDAVQQNAQEILAGPVQWVPVGPNARLASEQSLNAPDLLAADWTNVIDFDAWYQMPDRKAGKGVTIGRHSRTDLRKFPATRAAFAQIYGERSDVQVDMLGCPPELAKMLQPVHPSWKLRPFGDIEVGKYLDGLDAFVYYHREDWVEAFGYTVLEAMARGVPCVLPETLRPCFGDAAAIAPPEHALDTALGLIENPGQIIETGHDFVRERHSYEVVRDRLKAMIGPPRKPLAAPPSRVSKPAVLLMSTNGIGMGHLSRTMAIARRIQEPFNPILVSMSHGADVAHDFDLHVEFIPYHNYLGTDKVAWNVALREELMALIDGFDARALVFDGNSPFQGMLDAMQLRPQVWSVWSRRGMWRPNAGLHFVGREKHFDAVIEPDDLASGFDVGPTKQNRNLTRMVDPIRLLDKSEQLNRDQARRALGLVADKTTILVQLGGGNNFDMRLVRNLVLRQLGDHPEVQLVFVDWKISQTPYDDDLPGNAQRIETFPVARYLNAFDATVSAVGYNSFHEAMDAALPAIFIPNENPSQDDQLARANYAARQGAAIVCRRDRPESLIRALETILDADIRNRMSDAARAIRRPNGALDAAKIIMDLALTARGDRQRS